MARTGRDISEAQHKILSNLIDDYFNSDKWHVNSHISLADHLLNNNFVQVVHCIDCEYLGIKDFVYGYCKKNMCGIISPHDYCSQGKIKRKARNQQS